MLLYFRTNDGAARRFDGMGREACVALLENAGLQWQEITEQEFIQSCADQG